MGCSSYNGVLLNPSTVVYHRNITLNVSWSCVHSCHGCPFGTWLPSFFVVDRLAPTSAENTVGLTASIINCQGCVAWFVCFVSLLQGKYSTEKAATDVLTQCKNCPAGTYSDVEGLFRVSQCKNCPVGRYGLNPGLVSARSLEVHEHKRCTACPAGRYLDFTGASIKVHCKLCGLGKYLDTTNDEALAFNTKSTSCKDCSKGLLLGFEYLSSFVVVLYFFPLIDMRFATCYFSQGGTGFGKV